MEDVFRNEIKKLSSSEILVSLYDLIIQDSLEKNLRKVDGLYPFAETSDNEESSFLSSRRLLDKGLAKRVFIIDAPNKNGFPGFDSWSDKLLKKYGISALPVDFSYSGEFNTLTEAEALIRYSIKNNLKSLYILAPRFHLLRAFMTASSVVIRENPEMNLFAYSGAEQDWNQTVIHSQGIVKGKRIDLIAGEMERIKKYQLMGDLESTEKIIEYILHRK
ncbi:hypothetical protein HY449_03225 [Candidatus Pacearchaeota archaeon]|nr:hypothetical protein [Candidatus Pacearchaeota archaeon]